MVPFPSRDCSKYLVGYQTSGASEDRAVPIWALSPGSGEIWVLDVGAGTARVPGLPSTAALYCWAPDAAYLFQCGMNADAWAPAGTPGTTYLTAMARSLAGLAEEAVNAQLLGGRRCVGQDFGAGRVVYQVGQDDAEDDSPYGCPQAGYLHSVASLAAPALSAGLAVFLVLVVPPDPGRTCISTAMSTPTANSPAA